MAAAAAEEAERTLLVVTDAPLDAADEHGWRHRLPAQAHVLPARFAGAVALADVEALAQQIHTLLDSLGPGSLFDLILWSASGGM